MDDECLSLTWNNHGATYRKTLSVLREENTLTDVTLACDGQKFFAHKLVLVTCSDYFRSILGDIPCQHPIVYLRGVTAREMQALINFMYTGQTHIPQKEVPTLLSTAEALQIKGLGVFNACDEEGKSPRSAQREKTFGARFNTCEEGEKSPRGAPREKSFGGKKRRTEISGGFNGVVEEGGRNAAKTGNSREETGNILENLYSHHYALLSSPKRRKNDDLPMSEYGGQKGSKERSPHKENEDSNSRLTPTSLPSGILLDNFLTQPSNSSKSASTFPTSTSVASTFPPSSTSVASTFPPSSTSVASTFPSSTSTPPSPRDHSFSEEAGKDQLSSLSMEAARQRHSEKHANPGSSSLQSLPDPSRPEAKAASPRALNYSIAGLAGSKISYGAGALGHMSEESSTVHAETPENLIKSEIKEEALDFSNTTLSENHQAQSVNSSLSANTIEEETRMYLDAFARSANISWQQTTEEPVEQVTTEGRPFVCPICQKTFAKAAILKRHHLAHFRPYVCHICTRSFTRREVLAEHVLEHNGADLRMPCPVCAMTIKRKRNLQAHIKVKHPEYYRQKIANNEAMC